MSSDGHGDPAAQAPVTLQNVSDNFDGFRGRVVVIDGFLEHAGRTFRLLEGKRRTDGSLGENGEQYWCGYRGEPTPIWFESRETERVWRKIARPDAFGRGRRVIVQGRLPQTAKRAETPTSFMHGGVPNVDYSIREISAGPLKDIRIIEVKQDECEGWSPADYYS